VVDAIQVHTSRSDEGMLALAHGEHDHHHHHRHHQHHPIYYYQTANTSSTGLALLNRHLLALSDGSTLLTELSTCVDAYIYLCVCVCVCVCVVVHSFVLMVFLSSPPRLTTR
jgi:hypothetical protein